MRRGAEHLIETAKGLGVELCLANPGTTEMPIVEAIDGLGGIRPVLGLHETVCAAAADGYGRMAEKPALVLLHPGPGFANALANLHNARRAQSPIVNLIGEHATWHMAADPPLHSDMDLLTRWVSAWTRRNGAASAMARDVAEAVTRARSGNGAIASLVLPHDCQLARAEAEPVPPLHPERAPTVAAGRVEDAARTLRGARNPALFLGAHALRGRGLAAAGRIAAATGAALVGETGIARLDAGRDRPPVLRLPYFPEEAARTLAAFDAVIVCGAKLPVSFFGYHDRPARFLDGQAGVEHLATEREDAVRALEDLALALDAKADPVLKANEPLPPATGKIGPEGIAQAVARHLPEGAVVCVTAVTGGAAFGPAGAGAAPHSQLALTGGAIGSGLGMAVGAALACPGRRAVALEADGSGAYIMQALWTQAREGLDVTNVIYANRTYRILEVELERGGNPDYGSAARRMTEIRNPALDWVTIAKGMGVPGVRVETGEEMEAAVRRSFGTPGPMLIEAVYG
ncbi:MAG: acetolactate synthase large subunit [Geminicoccaceae bacterium]|nr:acetolactate synthase large subunit [Geminicoccaceae bacterium]